MPVLTVGVDAPIERITDVTPGSARALRVAHVVALTGATMVDRQLRARGIEDERVLAAMAARAARALRPAGAAATRL